MTEYGFSDLQLFLVVLVIAFAFIYLVAAVTVACSRSGKVLDEVKDINHAHRRHMLEIETRLTNIERQGPVTIIQRTQIEQATIDRDERIARGQALSMMIRAARPRQLTDGR